MNPARNASGTRPIPGQAPENPHETGVNPAALRWHINCLIVLRGNPTFLGEKFNQLI
jgi:hypothetical protein